MFIRKPRNEIPQGFELIFHAICGLISFRTKVRNPDFPLQLEITKQSVQQGIMTDEIVKVD